MSRKDVQADAVEQPAARTAQDPPAEAPIPEPTPAAGGRYRRLPDGTLEPLTDED